MEKGYPPHDERGLLEKIAQGDKEAFKIIHDHYWTAIYETAISFLKSREWAMDVVQDVFVKLWIKRAGLPAIENFKAWLFITARNELISALRKKLQVNAVNQNYSDRYDVQTPLPDDDLIGKQLELLLNQGIAQLPARQKLMYVLTRNQGLSHDEIAGKLGITQKTVSNTTTLALQNLRKYLQEHGDASL
ncbi:RNA polymerase sigma factor [Chitinophaga agrisoli]|nr:sigma-70 family RNA polymerase sigma factor [Chitinophaga agrisoli]